ncbi:MAG TPA: hypothetical protein VJ722_05145 [Rhodanobacteraceae bacterium]|nr:hypothetical protein [Rhodanobacteraceae bacterium]
MPADRVRHRRQCPLNVGSWHPPRVRGANAAKVVGYNAALTRDRRGTVEHKDSR